VKDFDTAGCAPQGDDWNSSCFKRPVKVSQRDSPGRAAARAASPSHARRSPCHVFLWHLTAASHPRCGGGWICCGRAARRCPDLRACAICLHALCAEQVPPRTCNPAGTLDRCRTVFLPRSCHLYCTTRWCGRHALRIDVSDGDLALCSPTTWRSLDPLPEVSCGAAPADLPGILLDFGDQLYGMYLDGGAKVASRRRCGKNSAA